MYAVTRDEVTETNTRGVSIHLLDFKIYKGYIPPTAHAVAFAPPSAA